MKCKNCGKGRPPLWIDGKGFCNDECHKKYVTISQPIHTKNINKNKICNICEKLKTWKIL